MGKLIKNHWARLLVLTAAAYQTAAAIYGFFWPKVFFDFLTTNLDPCVRPIPILQVINLVLGLIALAWEWPLPLFTKASIAAKQSYASDRALRERAARKEMGGTGDTTKGGMEAIAAATNQQQQQQEYHVGKTTKFLAGMHSSIEARLMLYPLSCLASFLLYQATNAALYYIVGMVVYFWAFSEGEVVMGVPWTLPRKGSGRSSTNV